MHSKLKTHSDLRGAGMFDYNGINHGFRGVPPEGWYGENRNCWGTLSTNSVEQHFKERGVHPDVISTLKGAGFFDKLVDGIKTAADFIIKNKDTIGKAIKTGVGVYNSMSGKGLPTAKGGKISGGMISNGAGGKLSAAHRAKITRVGQLMKQGATMADAWKIVKSK